MTPPELFANAKVLRCNLAAPGAIFNALLRDGVAFGFSPSLIEAISPTRVPLSVIKGRSVHESVATLQERVSPKIDIHRSRNKLRLIVRRERRYQVLCPELHVPEGAIAHLPRERQQTIITRRKVAVEPGVMKVGANAGVRNLTPADPVHLIKAALHVASLLAPAESGIDGDVFHRF